MLSTSLSFIDRWINYEGVDPDDHQFFFSRKREILFSRILILSIFICLFLIIKDLVMMKVAMSVMIDLVILLVIVSAFWMVRSGHHNFAKSYFLILMNGFTTLYASTLPADRGIFLYYFPLITIAFAVFDEEETYIRLVFILLPVFLLLLLVFKDFSFSDEIKLDTSKHGKYNLIINAVISSFMTIFFVEFMVKANRESERLLRLMTEDLRQKKDDIEKANRELDRFVYSTSHDLRAPLLSIKGLIRLAQADPDPSQHQTYFSMISDRTNKLDDFINEIIDYSRNARMELTIEETDIREIANGVISNLQFVENANRIRFEIHNSSGNVRLDKGRLKIVLNNLISNAIKYQNAYQEESWVKITTALDNGTCFISIRDNGIGIRPELQKRIFEMFYRATDKSTGSGLGLYIVKEIVNRLNGTIDVHSKFGEFTEFLIGIPVRAV
jgi:signal transduction histidine kinase